MVEIVYRQGDVLFRQISPVPAEAKPRKSRLIRRGEHGGRHMIDTHESAVLVEHRGTKYVLAPTGVSIVHKEHATLELPPGDYEVVIQRELSGAAARFVAD